MRYGVPYQGSKNSIAREIVEFLPAADTLIDICAGGCAITHAALELCQGFAPKWRHIISNDINPMPGRLFRDAIAGKYASETRWISREDFFALKDSDAYVKYCWSFANNGEQYMYSCEKRIADHTKDSTIRNFTTGHRGSVCLFLFPAMRSAIRALCACGKKQSAACFKRAVAEQ